MDKNIYATKSFLLLLSFLAHCAKFVTILVTAAYKISLCERNKKL